MFVKDSKESLDVKLIDFGFATKFDPYQKMDLILGSPLYMAPELIKQIPYNEKVDVWALGCITYNLVAGITPFYANKLEKI